jgi:hypothetical protein
MVSMIIETDDVMIAPENLCRREGVWMMPDNVALFATIVVLLPMIYFLLAAPAFLLVRLDIPPVALLLRAMFNGYFLTLAIAGAIGTIAVAVAGRLVLGKLPKQMNRFLDWRDVAK